MAGEFQAIDLTPGERAQLAEFTSVQYGFLKLDDDGSAKKKLIEKAISYYDNLLKIQTHLEAKEKDKENDTNKENDKSKENTEDKESKDAKDDEMDTGDADKGSKENKDTKVAKETKDADKTKKRRLLEHWVYCRLGHLHLLLEQFPKALSSYQKFYVLEKNHWRDLMFLYGLGMVYFHFNNYRWSVKTFLDLLYQDRGFLRANEVHARLGLMFKVLKNYEGSLKHFKLRLSDESECTISNVETRIHIAHLLEIQSRVKAAKESYDKFLQGDTLPPTLKATALRQLGWLYHTSSQLGEKENREQHAIRNLSKSVELDSSNGQTWYMLGRCYSRLGKVHDAFVSYRQSIDKSEANADTWCSIGVLYQQQNQPMDALQAYICAVQLDKSHSAAWTDLAILYETCNQPSDALACYLNATRNRDDVSANVAAKIKFLQQNLSNIPMQNLQNKPRTLPSIEEAWRLPIPAELTSRQNTGGLATPGQTQNGMSGAMSGLTGQSNASASDDSTAEKKKNRKRASKDSAEMPPPAPQQPPAPPPLNPQQMQLLQYLLSNKANLNQQQQQLLRQLQHQLLMSQQHVQQQQQQQQQKAQGGSPHSPGQVPQSGITSPAQAMPPPSELPIGRSAHSTPTSHPSSGSIHPPPHGASASVGVSGGYPAHIPASSGPASTPSSFFPHPPTYPSSYPSVSEDVSPSKRRCLSEDELSTYLSQQEAYLAEDMKSQMRSQFYAWSGAASYGGNGGPRTGAGNPPSGLSPSKWPKSSCGGVGQSGQTALGPASSSVHSSSVAMTTVSSTSQVTSPAQASKSGGTSGAGCSGPGGKCSWPDQAPSVPMYTIAQTKECGIVLKRSTQPPVTDASSTSSSSVTTTSSSTSTTDTETPTTEAGSTFKQPEPKIKKPRELSVKMSAQEILDATKGLGLLHKHTISILGDNLPPPAPPSPPHPPLPKEHLNPPTPSVYLESKKDAFSPELQQYCSSQPVVVIRGIAAALKLDLGLFSTKTLVEANPDHEVEVRTQKQQAPDENRDQNGRQLWPCYSSRGKSTVAKYAQYQATSFQESLKEEQDKVKGIHKPEKESDSDSNSSNPSRKRKFKTIRFGTNVDLSDNEKWRTQLAELTKLPAFTRVVSGSNMLSHVGHKILGMNTVQLYMKVPGSRTPGHQENNNFCSVNINIGPGDCEWFGVPDAYWGVIAKLCEKNGVDYLNGSWWPVLEDLYDNDVPVYRFIQKPGDLVWIGPGCVHWVQAIGWCNNIAWNVGPLTYNQYKLAIERYEYNKLRFYKSIVPMVHLSWNFARNIRITETKLYEQIKFVLMRSLRQIRMSLDLVEDLGKEVKYQSRVENEETYYCEDCEMETFCVLFVKKKDDKFVVYCQNCALKISPKLESFVILTQFKLSELVELYDNFVMFQQPHSLFMS